MKKVPTVRDLMSPVVSTLRPDADVHDAIEVLASRKASGVPVVDGEGHLVGVLTEKDCLRVLTHHAWAGELAAGKVADYMSKIKASVEPHMDLFTLAHLFVSSNFAILPVVENDRLAGSISRQDVLGAIRDLQRELAAAKKSEEQALKMMQSPASIEEFQRLAAKHGKEHLAAVLTRRHGKGRKSPDR